ncbi:MAG: DUF115 domain-containing protein [Treponema sp.]|nr:DUF115 domain-containing protein [Treponema sp.]
MHNLHSAYNPAGEAERYINSLKLNNEIKYFILIEPGLGYLVPPLRKKNPAAVIIALYAGTLPQPLLPENIPDSFWHNGMGKNLSEFLEQEIPDTEASKIKIIEWRPALAVYGGAYRNLLSQAVIFIKQADASARTQKIFGRRWFRNFFRNLALLKYIINPGVINEPVLITGAGPGLEDTIPVIKKERKNIILMAVSSSAAALRAAGINPDLIISADGGNWALLHLYECIRGITANYSYAVNLTAAVPSQCGNNFLLVICDGSLWQNLLLCELKIPFITLPQRGTVSASALDLALAMTTNNVYFTGVDLSNRDIQTHARPYSFDRLWFEKAGRLDPYYSCIFKRTRQTEAGGSNKIYASWFNNQLSLYPARLFSLGGNNQLFEGIKKESMETAGPAIKWPAFNTCNYSFNGNPAAAGARFLAEALINSKHGVDLAAELNCLLFPGETLSPQELGDAVPELALSNRYNHG